MTQTRLSTHSRLHAKKAPKKPPEPPKGPAAHYQTDPRVPAAILFMVAFFLTLFIVAAIYVTFSHDDLSQIDMSLPFM